MHSAVVAEVTRSGFVESQHRGSVVAIDSDGRRAVTAGDPDAPTLLRSCAKPIQAAVALRLLADSQVALDLSHVAIAASSHSGSPTHVRTVYELLTRAGVRATALQTPPDLPYGETERRTSLKAGRRASRVQHNCSGKHALLLAACKSQGWPLEDYLDPGHPVQVHIRSGIEELAGEHASATAVDGCGAPVLAVPLTALARAFSRLATATRRTPEHVVFTAMRRYPNLVAGHGRSATRIMRAVPRCVAKDGAEGMFALALRGGASLAVKIDDGSARATDIVAVAALRALRPDEGVESLVARHVLGGGRIVGEVRAAPWLAAS